MKTGVLVLVVTSTLVFALAAAREGVIGAAVTRPGPPGPGAGRQLPRNLAPSPDELRVFYQAPDGALATTSAVGPWSTPVPVTRPGVVRKDSPIAAVTHDWYGTFQAFYVQPDGAVGSALQVGGHWSVGAATQPGLVRDDAPLAAFRAGDERVWMVSFAPDSSLWVMFRRSWMGSVMLEHPWPGMTNSVPLSLIAPPNNGTGLVAVGDLRRNDWHAFYQATSGVLVDIPGRLTGGGGLPLQIAAAGMARPQSPIAALRRSDGQIHVFFVRPDGAVATTWSAWSDGRQPWAAPFPITRPGAAREDSSLAAVVREDGVLHVFYIRPDGAVATTLNKSGSPVWWEPIGITPPGAAGPASRLAAVLRRDQLHVFYQGPDGALATNWALGAWQTPLPITPPGAGRAHSSIAAVSGRW